MNRFNYGNIATNAMQTLSVGAFTASGVKRMLGRADQTLNNSKKGIQSVDELLEDSSTDIKQTPDIKQAPAPEKENKAIPDMQDNSEQMSELQQKMTNNYNSIKNLKKKHNKRAVMF